MDVTTHYLLYLYAESPVHTGAADSIDVLDLPVQREAATGYPVIWGQSLKGALRQAATDAGWGAALTEVFGSAIERSDEDGGTTDGQRDTTPGTLAVGDAQLVAMPVPTLRHTFGWLTSAIALARLARKYKILGLPTPGLPDVRSGDGAAASDDWVGAEREVLGPYLVPLGSSPDQDLGAWAGRIAEDAFGPDEEFRPFADKMRGDLLLAGADIVPDLLNECTEQAVRIQLGPSKTVQNGPFYSEYLPAETIMAASLTLRGTGDTEDNREVLRRLLHGQLLQIGGDETLGKGLMWGRLLAAAS
jgi:CRISPR-associated protein Cmr4